MSEDKALALLITSQDLSQGQSRRVARGVPGGRAAWGGREERPGEPQAWRPLAARSPSLAFHSVWLSTVLLGVEVQLPAEAPVRRSLGLARSS